MTELNRLPASFRDPAGFVFQDNGRILRQVNKGFAKEYEMLMSSGLYESLTSKGWLLQHLELPDHPGCGADVYKVVLPAQVGYISYPYEWCFDMLKDAARLTLSINELAIQHGMILKDASSFNVQFVGGKPIFIDSLSFVPYDPMVPWIAYRQFCQHFLFPLLIVHYKGIAAQQWLRIYLEGIPADITAKILPFSSRFKLSTFLHVHMQNRISRKEGKVPIQHKFTKVKMQRLLMHLKEVINDLHLPPFNTTWNNYYNNTILSQSYLKEKEKVFRAFVNNIAFTSAIDLGSNNGYFSKILASNNIPVIAVDADPVAINDLYCKNKGSRETNILPLFIDLSNPSPGAGWLNLERTAFFKRKQTDLVLALALVHHLYFVANIPFRDIMSGIALLTRSYAIVEMVMPSDEKVIKVSSEKPGLLEQYTLLDFEEACCMNFSVIEKVSLEEGKRFLFLLKKAGPDV